MNGVQTRFKCKLDVKRCKRFVFPPSSLLPRSNALKTKAIRYFQTDQTLTRIVSSPLHAIRPAHFAIRSERYKLIFYYAKNLDMTDTENFDFTPAWDFYDLEEDPHENHNLYNDPKYAPIIRQMKKDLLNLRKEVGDTDEKYPEMQELLEKYYK